MNCFSPGVKSRSRPFSDGTLNSALRRLGYTSDEMVVHGFRHMASTLLNEHKGYDPDLIEAQLAHKDSSMRGKYNNAQYVKKRAVMMQWWADYLDKLKADKKTLIQGSEVNFTLHNCRLQTILEVVIVYLRAGVNR